MLFLPSSFLPSFPPTYRISTPPAAAAAFASEISSTITSVVCLPSPSLDWAVAAAAYTSVVRSFVVPSFFEFLDSFPNGSCARFCRGRGPPSSLSLLHFTPPSLLLPPSPPAHLALACSTPTSFLALVSLALTWPEHWISYGSWRNEGRASEAFFFSCSVHPSLPPQSLLSLLPGPCTALALSTAAATTAATGCPLLLHPGARACPFVLRFVLPLASHSRLFDAVALF